MSSWLFRQWGKLSTRRNGAGDPVPSAARLLIDDMVDGRALPDDLIDAVLNGEVPPEDTGAVFQMLRSQPDALNELDETESVVDALKAPSTGPDLASSILGEVHHRRGLLDHSGLRLVLRWRVAAIAAVIALATGVFITQRLSPGAMSTELAPLGALLRAVPAGPSGVAIPGDAINLRARFAPDVAPRADESAGDCSARFGRRAGCPYKRIMVPVASHLVPAQWFAMISRDNTVTTCGTDQHARERTTRTLGSDYTVIRGLYSPRQSDDDAKSGGVLIFKR